MQGFYDLVRVGQALWTRVLDKMAEVAVGTAEDQVGNAI